jgi:PAS domain S-box-containing protein
MQPNGNETLQAILDAIPYRLAWKNEGLEFQGCNRSFATLVGLPDAASIAGLKDSDMPWSEEQARDSGLDDERAMAGGEAEPRVIALKLPSGGEALFETARFPIRGPDGAIRGLVAVYADIADGASPGRALAQDRFLLEALLETSSDYIYFKDRESRFLKNSHAHARHLGLADPAQMLGKTDFDFFTEAHAKHAFEEERRILETGETVTVENWDAMLHSGDAWVLTKKWPLRDMEGRIVGTFGISRDVTDRRRAEEKVAKLLEEKDVLLKEVRHRIKNNLSTIDSLLSLQASGSKDQAVADALEEVRRRIHGIGFLYEKTAQADEFGEVKAGDYLSSFIDAIVSSFPLGGSVEIVEEIGDFALDAKKLQTLGMIVHELVTNIMKHAFAGRPSGTIWISAARALGRVEAVVGDDGLGIPEGVDFESSEGLGLVLVGMLVKQLGGRIRIERGRGTRIVLEFEA